MLYRVTEVLKSFNKVLKALVIFGSSTFSKSPNDLDLLVVIDELGSVSEKFELELSISKSLRDLRSSKPFDIIVLDVKSLEENVVPGSFLTGLILGYKVIYDDLGFKYLIKDIVKRLVSTDDFILIKHGRKVNLKAVAIAKDSTINSHNTD